ncbi:MAG: hypothetical protein HYT87_15935 [Nitrospirae bacterium]|nr:hypothetical protein [Nitrospirota bacterium]
MTPLQCALMTAILLFSCGGNSGRIPAVSSGAAVWSEFETEEEVESVLPFMAEHGLALNRSVTLGATDFRRLESLVKSAHRQDVVVRLWPELKEEDGRWPSVGTRGLFIPFFYELMDFVESRKLPVDTLYVDLEPSLARGRELLAALSQPGSNVLDGLLKFYEAKVLDPDFEPGKTDFKNMVDNAHARGFKVFMTTIPFILDDFGDGDPSIQRALESPVEGIDWDEYSFQVYTTMFSNLYGLKLGPALVYSYARTARTQFGDKAALDLGLFLASPDVFSGAAGFESPAEMEADVLAAFAAGIPVDRLHFFSLEGVLGKPDRGNWFNWNLAAAGQPKSEPNVALLRGLLQSVDQQYP